MKLLDLPPIQGKRFDIEMLQYNTISLMKQADEGPTFLRHAGRVTHVVMTEKLFDELWPDPRRAWSICEMPLREKLPLSAKGFATTSNVRKVVYLLQFDRMAQSQMAAGFLPHRFPFLSQRVLDKPNALHRQGEGAALPLPRSPRGRSVGTGGFTVWSANQP